VERYGRFEVLGRIGRGGMAEILLARERSMAGATRHLVIKRILPEIADDDEMLHMFLDEARVVMGLSHPNLCQIYDVGEHDGTWYIAMEWVNGTTLHQLIKRAVSSGQVDFAITARVIGQCAEALHHAHTARDGEGKPTGLVHRDVSPHNIMVAYDGRVKLLDFGIAKSASSTHRTEAGVVKGKVCYMAPEQWLSEPLDGRTDVFALGACLVEALTGEVVFKRDTQMEVMRAILSGPTPSLAELNPRAPAALVAIAERALAKRPDDRFQSALEMSEALERYLSTLPEPISAARVAEYARRLLPSEVELGPVLERSVHGAHAQAPPLLLPPVPPGLLGAARSTPVAALPVPPPFQGRASGGIPVAPPEEPTEVTRADEVFDSDEAARLLERARVARVPTPHAGFAHMRPLGQPLGQQEESSPFDDAPTHQRPLPARSPSGATVVASSAPTQAPHPPVEPPDVRSSFDALVARPLARTLSMPVVRSIGRITLTVVPSAAAMLLILYFGFMPRGEQSARAPVAQPLVEAPAASAHRASQQSSAGGVQAPLAASPKPKEAAQVLAREADAGSEEAGASLLSINTRPWSTVYLGKRMLGTTPIGRVAVPRHALTLKLVDRDGRVHMRRLAKAQGPVREVFFDFERPGAPE